ncbi:hypothetical protein RRG08_038856 [Elysia crispata]|uniref:G-protein coupled receptors family 1 profile domain-containing protein n=1 Tax=Elysia crispata TaxID=231223 RepID=A0AAE0YSS6_9GAST|nr:hypothetical protein RRG08_038856 [Elysia crispata]
MTNTYLGIRLDPQFNRTRLMLRSVNFELAGVLFEVSKAVNRIFIPFVAEIILIVCVTIMTYKLRQSATIRHSMTSTAIQVDKSVGEEKEENTDIAPGSKLNIRELKVIQSVNMICVLFIIGTSPRCIIEGCDLALKEFGDHVTLYYFLNGMQDLFVALSIAANIIVYYRYNTKYRVTFHKLICFIRNEAVEGKRRVD